MEATGDGQSDGEIRLPIIEFLDRVEDLEHRIFEQKPKQKRSTKPRIQEAPLMIREKTEFLKYIEPKVCSFGPIHHGKGTLLAGEEIKMKLATLFARECRTDIRAAYTDIMESINNFRECYDQDVVNRYAPEQLIWMLLVDGCALLSYIRSFVSGSLYILRREDIPVDSVLGDVFSMENQLPYAVLDLLMKRTVYPDKIESYIDAFVTRHCMATGVQIKEKPKNENWSPNHLLHLLWMTVAGDHPGLYFLIRPGARWLPYSVKELKAVRIHLKPSTLIGLTDIAFKQHWFSGELHMHSLIFDNRTATILSNLIAYEMCPDFENDLEVTSYVCFLNSLIVNVEDVAELRSAQVLINCLPSDQHVFNLIRKTASNLTPNPRMHNDVKWGVQKYFNRERSITVATWLGAAAQVYFQSPWTTIATLAANFAIILTLVQTYYAIFPRQK